MQTITPAKPFTLAYNYGGGGRGKQKEYDSCIFLMEYDFKIEIIQESAFCILISESNIGVAPISIGK